jgi:hypothetical protein
MADIQTPDVDSKLEPVNVGSLRVNTGNHYNHTILVMTTEPILVQQWVP